MANKALTPMLSNYLFMIITPTIAQLNKLHLTTIIIRIIDGTLRFYNDKIQTHALGSNVSVMTTSNETLTFYFRFEIPNYF